MLSYRRLSRHAAYARYVKTIINNVSNNNRVTGTYAGGIFGYLSDINFLYVENTKNERTGIVTGDKAGGIIGYLSSPKNSIIKNTVNLADICYKSSSLNYKRWNNRTYIWWFHNGYII